MEKVILKAYINYCKQENIIFQEPSVVQINKQYAYLSNSYGLLAKYDLKERKFI